MWWCGGRLWAEPRHRCAEESSDYTWTGVRVKRHEAEVREAPARWFSAFFADGTDTVGLQLFWINIPINVCVNNVENATGRFAKVLVCQ